MRLIHTSTLQFAEFIGEQIPIYGILSHTWGSEEVSYSDMCNLSSSDLEGRSGYHKIVQCSAKARAEGLAYIWVDTCCIDKSSSAELTEAINSMFQWYAGSEVCWALLSDVSLNDKDINFVPQSNTNGFHQSRWFQRGWTLQEILAPRDLIFLNEDWDFIGLKSTLLTHISQATGIKDVHLYGYRKASVAAKMSWASKRKTTRVEDMAYCLLGLFDVNMPLLYGEGVKAFLRLQQEIAKTSNDESLFACSDESLAESGLFAQSPVAFADSGSIIPYDFVGEPRAPYSFTNRGLAVELDLHDTDDEPYEESYFDYSINTTHVLAFPDCRRVDSSYATAILLKRIGFREFVRSDPSTLWTSYRQTRRSNNFLGYIRPILISHETIEVFIHLSSSVAA